MDVEPGAPRAKVRRWLASAGWDKTIRLWPVPDCSKPPFHKLLYPEVLADLRSRTNLRAVSDPASATGWKLDRGPFPGWAKRPESWTGSSKEAPIH